MNRKILLKYFSWIGFTLSITTFLILCFSGCSSRRDKPVILNDSTIVYPSKYEGGLQPKITLTKRVSKKTGKPIKPGTRFNLQEDTKLFAIVDLEKQTTKQNRDLMFHIDWVDSSGNSFYKKRIDISIKDTSSRIIKKRIDISIKDTSSRIISSISLSPQKRQPGNYTARLYLFRELIAEKRFLLVESLSDTLIVKKKSVAQDTSITIKKVKKEKLKKSEIKSDNIMASLVLCRKISKKT
nr:hypothetical protein [Ignavibacteriaceae bacterium]